MAPFQERQPEETMIRRTLGAALAALAASLPALAQTDYPALPDVPTRRSAPTW
jgi:hypothetical protein